MLDHSGWSVDLRQRPCDRPQGDNRIMANMASGVMACIRAANKLASTADSTTMKSTRGGRSWAIKRATLTADAWYARKWSPKR